MLLVHFATLLAFVWSCSAGPISRSTPPAYILASGNASPSEAAVSLDTQTFGVQRDDGGLTVIPITPSWTIISSTSVPIFPSTTSTDAAHSTQDTQEDGRFTSSVPPTFSSNSAMPNAPSTSQNTVLVPSWSSYLYSSMSTSSQLHKPPSPSTTSTTPQIPSNSPTIAASSTPGNLLSSSSSSNAAVISPVIVFPSSSESGLYSTRPTGMSISSTTPQILSSSTSRIETSSRLNPVQSHSYSPTAILYSSASLSARSSTPTKSPTIFASENYSTGFSSSAIAVASSSLNGGIISPIGSPRANPDMSSVSSSKVTMAWSSSVLANGSRSIAPQVGSTQSRGESSSTPPSAASTQSALKSLSTSSSTSAQPITVGVVAPLYDTSSSETITPSSTFPLNQSTQTPAEISTSVQFTIPTTSKVEATTVPAEDPTSGPDTTGITSRPTETTGATTKGAYYVTVPVIVYVSHGGSKPYSTTTVHSTNTHSTVFKEPEETVTVHATATKSVTVTAPGSTVTVTDSSGLSSTRTTSASSASSNSSSTSSTSSTSSSSTSISPTTTSSTSTSSASTSTTSSKATSTDAAADGGLLTVIPITPSGYITITETKTETETETKTVTTTETDTVTATVTMLISSVTG